MGNGAAWQGADWDKCWVAWGGARYSLYIWHQAVFAFYRYVAVQEMHWWDNLVVLGLAGGLGWLSYVAVERWLNAKREDAAIWRLLAGTSSLAVGTSLFGIFLYLRAGVVRDVPELNCFVGHVVRGQHAKYSDKVRKMDVPFAEDGRTKVLVLGNSFARDFVNVLLESDYGKQLDVTYIYFGGDPGALTSAQWERAKAADRIFIRGMKRLDGIAEAKQYGIGTKSYGYLNGHPYNRRWRKDYYSMKAPLQKGIEELYVAEKGFWGDHYVDFIAPVVDEKHWMPIFTPGHQFISQDCRHLTSGGAQFYAKLLPLEKWVGQKDEQNE